VKLERTTFETSRAGEYFIYREERFELNAILPDTRRIEYIEEKLKENGVRARLSRRMMLSRSVGRRCSGRRLMSGSRTSLPRY
jgi:hypothetical protein